MVPNCTDNRDFDQFFMRCQPQIQGSDVQIRQLSPDTLFAIARQSHNGKPTGLPDKVHFHQLLMRSFMILSGKKLPLAHANPLASVAIWPFVVLTCTLGIILLTEKQLPIFTTVFLARIFVISYLTICQWAKTRNMPRFGLYLFGNSSDQQTDP